MGGDDADVLQVNAGARDQEMADGQRELAGNAQRRLVDQQIERRADRPFDASFRSAGPPRPASPVSTAETRAGNEEKATS